MTTLPGPQALESLKLFIESIVDQRLQTSGVVRAAPGPREIRIAAGLEIRRLAEISGVSAPTISRLENFKIKNPSPATMNALARALGISEREYRTAFAQAVTK